MTFKEKRTGLIQFIVVIIFIIMSFVASSALKIQDKLKTESTAGDLPINVTATMFKSADHNLKFQITGSVDSRTNVNIVPQVSGKIISVNDSFFAGGEFKAGDILFQIDPIDFKLQIQQLDAEVSKARTNLDLTKAESSTAKKEWKQVRGKRPVPDLVAKIPQLNEAQANLAAAQAKLESARINLERTNFSMPFNGRVLESNLAIGQFVTAGQNYGSVYDQDNIEIKASLNEQQLYWLKNTTSPDIKITHSSFVGSQNLSGFVKRQASPLNPNTRFADIAFGLNDNTKSLIPGQFVTIDIEGPEYSDITILPLSAYQKDGHIYLINDNQKLRLVVPDILYATDDVIAIKNLKGTHRVVTSMVSGAIENASIKIINSADDKEK